MVLRFLFVALLALLVLTSCSDSTTFDATNHKLPSGSQGSLTTAQQAALLRLHVKHGASLTLILMQ
jgi:hypothetical protein